MAQIDFPELERESTMEMPFVACVSATLGLTLAHAGWRLGPLAALPYILFLLNSARIAWKNAALRRRWARSFSNTISGAQMQRLACAAPGGYILHLRAYGGFDAVRLPPAAVLEQRGGALLAVQPESWRASWSAIQKCEEAGVEVVRH